MDVRAHWEPSEAAIKAATPHVEAARNTDMHASHHARAALIDAWAADQPRGAVEREAIQATLDKIDRRVADGGKASVLFLMAIADELRAALGGQ